MPMIYFEVDKLKDLSNKDLVSKCQELESKYTMAQTKTTSSDIMQQMTIIYEAYNAELESRIINNLLDEDEIDDIEEQLTLEKLKNEQLNKFK